jgi:N-acyl-D-amino-acid deacylase
MSDCHTLIRNVTVFRGESSNDPLDTPEPIDVALSGDRIVKLGRALSIQAERTIDGEGLALAPGFIDTHTHDDLFLLRTPQMLPKLSQGVTTVIVGNCGISAAPVLLRGPLPDPMNLLGQAASFQYADFASYVAAIEVKLPAVNVAALVGHTSLRNNHMDRLDRAATALEISAMSNQLQEALDAGALGLSSGLAYLSANSATTEEVISLAQPLAAVGAIYTTHMRTEGDAVLAAMDEAFSIGREACVPVIISHLKCAGVDNWGRSLELLHALDRARSLQEAACDCYPYAAGSSTLDLRQVDERVLITITWSTPHPEVSGKSLAEIARSWGVSHRTAAERLHPAGAIYHSISEEDMRRILAHPASMIGSDGLPNDPHPHPRLWGTFPRVLGHYCRDLKLLTLSQAIHKMTAMPARRFGIANRGLIREGYFADLTLFDSEEIIDKATFVNPVQPAEGVKAVWVNGALAYDAQGATGQRSGRFLRRQKIE